MWLFWTSKVCVDSQRESAVNLAYIQCTAFFGGNSTKATSGINGALTRTQVDSKIQDSVKQFYDDTLKSARDKARPDLIKVLTYKSAAAVEWLQDVFNLDLTLVSRLGYVPPNFISLDTVS
jgi:succinate dehydrogenase/fumarate reductase flavoprotein subunit